MNVDCRARAFSSQAPVLQRHCQLHLHRVSHNCAARRDRTGRRRTQARAGAQDEPEKAAGAIALGLKAYQNEDYSEAIQLFKKALDLPGTGIKQYRDKPAIASDGEKISAFYNIACCLSQTGNIDDGLLALLEALSMGYDDYQQIRTDTDLEQLRTDKRFEPLMQKFQKVSRKGLLQDFFSNISNPLQK